MTAGSLQPLPGSPAPVPPLASVRVRLPTHRVRVTYIFLGLIGLVFAAQFILETFVGSDLILEY